MLLVLFYELSIGKGFDNVRRVLGITPNSDVHCTCTLGNDAHKVEERDHEVRAGGRPSGAAKIWLNEHAGDSRMCAD